MKKLILFIVVFFALFSSGYAQTDTTADTVKAATPVEPVKKRKFSVIANVGRTAFFEKKLELRQFTAAVALAVPISKKFFWQVQINQPLDFRYRPTYRIGISYKIY